MSHKLAVRIAAVLAFAAIASQALAHAQLQKATPPVGGAVAVSPGELRLKFSEGVEPRFSGITLASEAGAAVPLGKASLDPADSATLVAPVPAPLKPGVYKVTWHVVSVDTHKTQGSFSFTVSP
jgi:methionine-rich copper-binding protein CopC